MHGEFVVANLSDLMFA